MMRIRALTVTAAALVAGGLFAIPAAAPAVAGVDPAHFTSPVANPYFPLKPGTVFVYRGSEDRQKLIEHLRVTHHTKKIEGVTTIVINDVLYSNGRLNEATHDFYADDNNGTTWYFGERTATYDKHGHVKSREGSWLAGRNGGEAGVIMPHDPKPTDAYRQEFLPKHAEDQAWIVANHGTARVPYGRVKDVVRSYEWTRLEPNVISLKLYAPHLGIVAERDVAGGTENMRLVAVHHH
jgi:hypothetical protein